MFRKFYVSPSPDRTAFARVFRRGTPGVRSLPAERRNDGVSVRGEERSRKRYAVRDDEVCVPYKRKGTTPDRLKRQKVGSDSEAL